MSESGILIEPSSKIKGVRKGEGSGAFFSMDFEGILREDTDNIIDRALKEDRSFLMEHECKEVLENIGIKTTGGRIATSAGQAAAISKAIGYPVALKIVSPDVIHKTDGGGVKLNLRNERALIKAFNDIVESFKDRHVVGVSVQKMAEQGIEAIIGVTRDPSFGPVLMFGLGGVFVEVLKDVTFRVLPITEDDAAEMIDEIKGSKLLKGYRGKAGDIDELRSVLLKISQLVTRHPQIRELDLNPVFVYPSGCLAVDARIFVDGTLRKRTAAQARPTSDLRALFYPQSIAVLGASDSPGKLGYNVFQNLLNHGFKGSLYPINKKKDSILGVKAYKSVLDVEGPVDAAIIIVPAETVPMAIEECCAKGVKYQVVETAGFAEIGDEGKKAQAGIRVIVKKRGCRILGPNCSGVINTHHDMVQSIGLLEKLGKGNVGLIAQAGVYAAGILAGLRNVLAFGIVATIVMHRWARARQMATGQQFPVLWAALGLIFGLPLLTLAGRKAVLTPTGQVLYRRGKALLDEATRVERAAADLARGWARGGRDVFLFLIAGAKLRNPAAAKALIARLSP